MNTKGMSLGLARWGMAIRLCCIAACLIFPVSGAGAGTHGFRSLYSFQIGSDGANPYSPLFYGTDGNLYGTTNAGGLDFGTVFRMSVKGKKEAILYAFSDNPDGAGPGSSGVVADDARNLYGTTQEGGTFGDGTIFKVTPDGTETVINSFTGVNGGSFPNATLIIDGAGNLYGTAGGGGANAGVVFTFSAAGTFSLLHTFTGGSDGSAPEGALWRDGSGNLFGTTGYGGSSSQGTVYKIGADGTEQVLYAFTGADDGGHPNAGVIEDAAGNLYGTATEGGANGLGTVYKLAPGGALTVLHAFSGGNDGQYPYCGLVRDSKGNLYGTTEYGGALSDAGTVFRVTAKGRETVLHTFDRSDGANPTDGLVAARGANGTMLYGTTVYGGVNNRGTVFVLKE